MRACSARQIFGFFFTSRQSRCTQAFGSWLAQDRARRQALLVQKRNEPGKSHCARRTRSLRRSRGSARHSSRVKPPGYFLCFGNASSCGGGYTKSFSRRAVRPRFAYHHNDKALLDSPPTHKEGGGAPKGASNYGRAISGARQRAKQARPRIFAARLLCRGALTFRRSTAALRRLLGSSPGRASWNYRVRTGGPSPAPVQRAPRGPVIVPSRKASLNDSTSEMMLRNIIGDACQQIVIGMGTVSRRGRAHHCAAKFRFGASSTLFQQQLGLA